MLKNLKVFIDSKFLNKEMFSMPFLKFNSEFASVTYEKSKLIFLQVNMATLLTPSFIGHFVRVHLHVLFRYTRLAIYRRSPCFPLKICKNVGCT